MHTGRAISGAAAETPLGFVLFLFVLVKTLMFIRRPYNPNLPIFNPVLRQSVRWHTTAIFFWCFVLSTGVDAWWFLRQGGWAASGWSTPTDAVFDSLVVYGKVLLSYSGWRGWLAGIAVEGG